MAVGVAVLIGLGLPNPSEASPRANESIAEFSLEVEAGAMQAGRLTDVPAGSQLSLSATTDGPVQIWLLDDADYRRFPTPRAPLFRGKTSTALSSAVFAPRDASYYVVIDNRDGTAARSVQISIGGLPPAKPLRPRAAMQRRLSGFVEQLATLLVFDSFRMRVETCPASADASNAVVFCEQTLQAIGTRLPEDVAEDVLVFRVLHESAHRLLAQWGAPDAASERAADRLAAALLLLLDQPERLASQAAAGNLSLPQLVPADDPHALTPERAAALPSGASEPQVALEWLPRLAPHMRPAFVEALRRRDFEWLDAAVLDEALEGTRATRR